MTDNVQSAALLSDLSLVQRAAALFSDLSLAQRAEVLGRLEHQSNCGFMNGLPPLLEKTGSTSDPSEKNHHKQAQVKLKPLAPLKPFQPTYHPSIIWNQSNAKGLRWGSERDIQGYVKDVLIDAIRAAGLNNEVHWDNELSVFDLRPDIWLLTNAHAPIGVVWVKKPGSTIMESSNMRGQIFDYMLRLRSFHGLKHVFGIVSTYQQWRFYWLPEADGKAASAKAKREAPAPRSAPDLPDIPDLCTPSGIEEDDIGATTRHSQKRILSSSDVISYDDPRLPHLLVSVITKMVESETLPVPLVSMDRQYLELDERGYSWCRLPPAFDISLGKMPRLGIKRFILIADLRGGIHGRVWLAATYCGTVCVIKFMKDKKLLDGEVRLWRTLWPEFRGVRAETLGGQKALIMPYVKACEGSSSDPSIIAATQKAVERMASLGYCHEDLAWRHVGLYRQGGKLSALLFDLADVKHRGVDNSVNCEQKMLEDLGLPYVARRQQTNTNTTTPTKRTKSKRKSKRTGRK